MRETVILARNKSILFFAVLLFVSCAKLTEADNQKIKEALNESAFTTSYSKNIDMDILEDGTLKLNLKGSAAKSYTADNTEFTALTGPIHISIYEAEELQSEVYSDSAFYNSSSSIFELFGSVKVFTQNGKRLRTDNLIWERNTDQISTEDAVIIITKTDSINAKGLTGASDLSEYTLHEVTGQTIIN